ncbi:TPA: hypothetical protein NUW79_003111 [Escherichia coli]|nr:hypothetical protein [Escherichia coli]HCJ8610273.1 hypothetical protein [Escherichia coli]
MTGIQCKCKKGYVSGWDGKCGNCRTKQEQREHEKTMAAMPEYSPDAHATYRFLRWGK